MSLGRAITAVFVCTLLFSGLGGAAGFLLGKLMPGYYRAVFRSGDAPFFDPVQVGLGLGVTQGMVAGAVIGLALVGLVAWHAARSNRA
jgi:hypothetical protein